MGTKSTFIKLDRNIINWRWYQNANTFRVFIHLLMIANVSSHNFEDIIIRRGEVATSYDKIANTLNLTVQQVRTAISHLKSTGEITAKIYPKFQVITITNYNLYQDKTTGKNSLKQHSINIQITGNQQQYKNNKEHIKNNKENNALSGVAPNGVEYQIIDGRMINENGREINAEGFEIIDFGFKKRNF